MISTILRRLNLPILIAWLLCAQPLFTLIVKGWSSGILLLGGLSCLIALLVFRDHMLPTKRQQSDSGWEFQAFWVASSLLFISIGLTGMVRQDLHYSTLDSPARFLLAIPVFILLRRLRANLVKALLLCVLLGLLFTLVDQTFFPSKNPWDKTRMSSHFSDPLAFGYITLSFSMMALTSLSYAKHQSHWFSLLTVAAIGAGFYMSIMTASRTGWLAVPLVILFNLYLQRRGFGTRTITAALCILATALFMTYSVSETVRSRIDAALQDVAAYSFNGIAPDTSVGMRITFLRMAADMIVARPLTGHGDTQQKKPEIPDAVKAYASQFTIDFALSSGFHNEVVTNTVQYGVLSGLAALLLFIVPLAIYWKNLKHPSESSQLAAALGIAFTLTYFVSSLSTEVFGLKYTVSLYALMTAILCAAATRIESPTP